MMSMLCNCCVRELLILARTWFAFGLPSKTGCDIRRRPLSCSVGGEGWISPVILLPLAQRDRRRLERRVASLPSP
jgi:hypothetical protein